MEAAKYFEGVNLRKVKEQIIFSIVVDFEGLLESNMTLDMKHIIRMMKANGIYNFLSINPQHLYKEAVISFFREAKVCVEGIRSSIFGENVLINCQDVADAFKMENKGLLVEALKQDYPFLWDHIRTSEAPSQIKMTAKKGLIKKEFGYVVDITNKIVMGWSGSYDQLSSTKFPVFGALVQENRINWPEYIYRQLCREVNKAEWISSEGRFSQKLAFGTQLSWILEYMGMAKGRAETFVSSKRLGHFSGDKSAAIKFLEETRSGTPSRQPYTDDSEATESDEESSAKVAEDKSSDTDSDDIPLVNLLKRKLPEPAMAPDQTTPKSPDQPIATEVPDESSDHITETILIQDHSPKRKKSAEVPETRLITYSRIKMVELEEEAEEPQDEEPHAVVVPLLSNLPSTPEEDQQNPDIYIEFPQHGYTFNLSTHNYHNLSATDLISLKTDLENLDFMQMHLDWQRYRCLSFADLERLVQELSWKCLTDLEDGLTQFCQHDFSMLFDKSWFTQHFPENMDKFIIFSMNQFHDFSLKSEEVVEKESVFEVGTSSEVPEEVEKEREVVEKDVFVEEKDEEKNLVEETENEEEKEKEKEREKEEEEEELEEVEKGANEKEKKDDDENQGGAAPTSSHQEARSQGESQNLPEERLAEDQPKPSEEHPSEGKLPDQNPPDERVSDDLMEKSADDKLTEGAKSPEGKLTDDQLLKLPEDKDQSTFPTANLQLPLVERSLVEHTESAPPKQQLSDDIIDLIKQTIADEVNKAVRQLVTPQFAHIREELTPLKDLKEQLAPLQTIKEQLAEMLSKGKSTPAPTNNRMPVGFSDLMDRVEAQLARFADGKKGEEKEKDDSLGSLGPDDIAHESRSKQRQDPLLITSGPSSQTGPAKKKVQPPPTRERSPAPKKKRRTSSPHVTLEWEGKELSEVEGFLPVECVDQWGKAKKEFIEKYYLWEILQDANCKPQEIFINFMEMNFPDLWEKLKEVAAKEFKVFPMIPEFRAAEAPILPNGQVDEEELDREIKMEIIRSNLRSPEEQQFASDVIKRKFGLLPVKKRPIGGKPMKQTGTGKQIVRSRRIL